jgi:hypothetical protein
MTNRASIVAPLLLAGFSPVSGLVIPLWAQSPPLVKLAIKAGRLIDGRGGPPVADVVILIG